MGSSHFPNDQSITVVLSVNVWPGSTVDVIMAKSPSIDCHSLLYIGNSAFSCTKGTAWTESLILAKLDSALSQKS